MLFQRWYLVKNEIWANLRLSRLFQGWNEVVFSTLIYGYHNFIIIVSSQQTCFWCQLRFNVVSTLTSTLNQRLQYDVDSTLISRRPISRLYFNIYQRWNNVKRLLGTFWSQKLYLLLFSLCNEYKTKFSRSFQRVCSKTTVIKAKQFFNY